VIVQAFGFQGGDRIAIVIRLDGTKRGRGSGESLSSYESDRGSVKQTTDGGGPRVRPRGDGRGAVVSILVELPNTKCEFVQFKKGYHRRARAVLRVANPRGRTGNDDRTSWGGVSRQPEERRAPTVEGIPSFGVGGPTACVGPRDGLANGERWWIVARGRG